MALGGAPILKTGTLASSANTANQVILTHSVAVGKKFVLNGLELNVRLTTFATTATNFGTASLRVAGTAVQTFICAGPGVLNNPILIKLAEPMIITGSSEGLVVDVVCTPSASTGFTWEANIQGAEN